MNIKSRLAVCAAVTSLSATVSAAFSIAALAQTQFANVLAMYGVARSVPLAVAAYIVWARKSAAGVRLMCLLMAAVQLLDAVVGFAAGDMSKVIGPLVLALMTLAARALA